VILIARITYTNYSNYIHGLSELHEFHELVFNGCRVLRVCEGPVQVDVAAIYVN
jgi:hypothetical protein